jgi:Ran GTPase-activating protein (RanGAP) involved in mRNA processing and transport
MSTAGMLFFCQKLPIEYIDLSDNFLDVDGGKAFNEFLWTNSHLKRIKLTNCKLGKRTAELFLEAWEENKSL